MWTSLFGGLKLMFVKRIGSRISAMTLINTSLRNQPFFVNAVSFISLLFYWLVLLFEQNLKNLDNALAF